MTTEIIVIASRQSSTGLAKDRFENVWHFLDTTAASLSTVCKTAFDKIWDFYQTAGGSGPSKVADFISHTMGEVITLTAYNRADAVPRPEVGNATFVYTTPGSSDMPEEVALCISYYTDRNLASKRGRLYIGPLNIGAINALVNDPARPKPSFVSALAAAGGRCKIIGDPAITPTFTTINVAGTSTGTAWALYSPTLGTYAAVLHGWVDDEWDGQSRRRVEASSRTIY